MVLLAVLSIGLFCFYFMPFSYNGVLTDHIKRDKRKGKGKGGKVVDKQYTSSTTPSPTLIPTVCMKLLHIIVPPKEMFV